MARESKTQRVIQYGEWEGGRGSGRGEGGREWQEGGRKMEHGGRERAEEGNWNREWIGRKISMRLQFLLLYIIHYHDFRISTRAEPLATAHPLTPA